MSLTWLLLSCLILFQAKTPYNSTCKALICHKMGSSRRYKEGRRKKRHSYVHKKEMPNNISAVYHPPPTPPPHHHKHYQIALHSPM